MRRVRIISVISIEIILILLGWFPQRNTPFVKDVEQIFSEVGLELLITLGALVILSLFGLYFLRRATGLSQGVKQSHPMNQVLLPPAIPPEENKLAEIYREPITTQVWIQRERQRKVDIPNPMPLAFEPQVMSKPSSSWWTRWSKFLLGKDLTWRAGFWQGISTEFFGAVVTTFFLGMLVLVTQQYQAIQNRRFLEEQAIQNRQAELILQMGSPTDGGFASEAARQLHAEGWLEDGTLQDVFLMNTNLQGAALWYADLQGAFLVQANLQDAALGNANLQDAVLERADLQGADLMNANLQDANLRQAKFQGAFLMNTNLQGANLRNAIFQDAVLQEANLQGANLERARFQGAFLVNANLQDANLERADLQGANLRNANLQGADLEYAIFDENTVLPDAELMRDTSGNFIFTDESYWTPDTDMTRYTDPEHPNFWQPPYLKRDFVGDRPPWVTDDMLTD